MEWLVVLILTVNGQTAQVPWALTHDQSSCALTGVLVTAYMEHQMQGLLASFTCVQRVAA